MNTPDQNEVIAFLARPETLADGSRRVDTNETHISVVFLGRERVLKLKRAVTFPFLDFATPEQRRVACEAEVRLNRRTAPDLYKGVLPVTREGDGTLALDGAGEPVDWVVEMRRFDEETLFDRKARRGELDRRLMEELAEAIARFHAEAEVCSDQGGREGIAQTLESNAAALRGSGKGILSDGAIEALIAETDAALARQEDILEARRGAGRVRRCHGDLHLRNIFFGERGPTLFDAIEFNDLMAVIDVLYDLSFLLMDLDRRDLRGLANLVLNRYLDVADDTGGLPALPLFLSMRATIRAFVGAATAHHMEGAKRDEMAADAAVYLEMARGYLAPPAPRLIAVGGLSGSGKSRLGREVAPHIGAAPGARVVRSDVLRKRLAGVGFLDRLGPEGYTPEMGERTYQALYDEVRKALATGQSAVADAVFAKPEQRDAIARVAAEAGVPFQGFWLEAPPEVMETRVTKRRGNVSDADARVVRQQLGYDLGKIDWMRLDSSGPREQTVSRALEALKG